MASPSERIVAGDGASRMTARPFNVAFSLVVAERRPWIMTPGELGGTQQDWDGATDGLRDDPRKERGTAVWDGHHPAARHLAGCAGPAGLQRADLADAAAAGVDGRAGGARGGLRRR